MSSTRSTLDPYKIWNAQDLSNSATSSATSLKRLDAGLLTIETTGAPTGQISVQFSNDGSTWYDLQIGTIPALAGSPDNYVIDLNTIDFPLIRVGYARTSGSGTATATITAKGR